MRLVGLVIVGELFWEKVLIFKGFYEMNIYFKGVEFEYICVLFIKVKYLVLG